MDAHEAWLDAAARTVELLNRDQKNAAQATAMIYKSTRELVDEVVTRDGSVIYSLIGLAITSIRVGGLLVVTPSTVLMTWRKGLIVRKSDSIAIARSDITKVDVGPGSGATAGGRILTVDAAGSSIRFGIPLKEPEFEQALLAELRGGAA